jgi:hypothetical protein
VRQINDAAMSVQAASGFKIEVLWAKTTPPTPDTFPRFQGSGFQRLMYATNHKADGAQAGQAFEEV